MTGPRHLVELSPDGRRFRVRLTYSAETVDHFKRCVPAGRFVRLGSYWDVPARWASCEGLGRFIADEPGAAPGVGVMERIAALAAEHRGLEAVSASSARIEGFPRERLAPGCELKPYQEAGVAYALKAQRCFIADPPGLGKTIQALATLWLAGARRVVVVCPSAVVLNWEREVRRWCPGWTVSVVISESHDQAYSADVVIVTWGVVRCHVGALQKERPVAVVFDESHRGKNGESQRTKAAIALGARAKWAMNLTGTPTENGTSIELLSQLRMIRRLSDFGGSAFFKGRYCGPTEKTITRWDPVLRRRVEKTVREYKGASHLHELNRKLRSTCWIRREKSEVAAEIPEKQRIVVDLPIANMAEYRRAERDVAGWLRDHGRADAVEGGEEFRRISVLKRLAAEGKMAAAVEWISDLCSSREAAIVFAHHVEIQAAIADRLEASGLRIGRLVAGLGPIERQGAFDRFAAGEYDAVVASIEAYKEGWQGTRAEHVVFVEFRWTSTTHDQCEDRAHRIGQRRNVTAWYLKASGTIDDATIDLLDEKRTKNADIADGVVSAAGPVDDAVLRGLIASLRATV